MGIFRRNPSPETTPAPQPGSHVPDQTPRHQAPPPVGAHLRPVGSTAPDQRPKQGRK